MIFDVYYPFQNKEGKYIPGTKPTKMTWEQVMNAVRRIDFGKIVDKVRSGDLEAKKQLPAICWTGSTARTRSNDQMQPTGFVMVDIDKMECDPQDCWNALRKQMGGEVLLNEIVIAHVTPSGHGLRIVFKAQSNTTTLEENMNWLNNTYDLGKWGKFDTSTKDFSRLSFLVKDTDMLHVNMQLLNAEKIETGLINQFYKAPGSDSQKSGEKIDGTPSLADLKEEVETFTDDEKARYDVFEYRGVPIKVIVEKYVEVKGSPTSGEIHNFYNEMVKNFRCICDNNKRLLLYILPRFGHTVEECWSQVKSICRVNTLSTLPKSFYFFLKDNGYYKPKETEQGSLRAFMMDEETSETVKPPYLPPVFRELVGIAPSDFILSSVNALLPILGTLTSYVQARYPYDDRLHTTSFFSVIYAPPGTGKGFVERFMDMLFEDLKLRDFVQSERENIYLRTMMKKSQNEKSPDIPHTSLRIIPPKNSEAEFLQKQRDNHGYHMFTYAAEMDSWAKGVKAAGGNKDDMIRIAWDNGEYGQQFKSVNTFKGTVNLYWNVLITGTISQVEHYFKNVENGLVTRCSFSSIENQEFSAPPKWGKLNERQLSVIKKFVKRCDLNTYETPCEINVEDLALVSDEDFDKEVDWRFKFRTRQTLDLTWVMPVIDSFHKEQVEKAALDVDKARDVFRRRVGVRGFRLALLCMCLWERPRKSDLEKCKEFINWWMHQDIEMMLNLWGTKYNEQAEPLPKLAQRNVYTNLPKEFSRADVYTLCMKQGIKTPIRRIIFEWKKLGYIEKIDKDNFKKKS